MLNIIRLKDEQNGKRNYGVDGACRHYENTSKQYIIYKNFFSSVKIIFN